jgi:hypothetical protein
VATILDGDYAQVPNAPKNSRSVRFSFIGGDLWQGSRVLRTDTPIAREIQLASVGYDALYVAIGVRNPSQTSFAEVIAVVDRMKAIIAGIPHPNCRIEIVVFIPSALSTLDCGID